MTTPTSPASPMSPLASESPVLTILEGRVESARVGALRAAYARAIAEPRPAGLVRSDLLQGVEDPAVWRIQSLWTGHRAIAAMRGQGTPTGVLVFRAAGAEPVLARFEVAESLPDAASRDR